MKRHRWKEHETSISTHRVWCCERCGTKKIRCKGRWRYGVGKTWFYGVRECAGRGQEGAEKEGARDDGERRGKGIGAG